jgi:hypothetical protein
MKRQKTIGELPEASSSATRAAARLSLGPRRPRGPRRRARTRGGGGGARLGRGRRSGAGATVSGASLSASSRSRTARRPTASASSAVSSVGRGRAGEGARRRLAGCEARARRRARADHQRTRWRWWVPSASRTAARGSDSRHVESRRSRYGGEGGRPRGSRGGGRGVLFAEVVAEVAAAALDEVRARRSRWRRLASPERSSGRSRSSGRAG